MNDAERLREIADFVRSIPYPLQDVDEEGNVIEKNSPASLADCLIGFADEREARTGDIAGDYQEVIDEICRRTGGIYRWIAIGLFAKEPCVFTNKPSANLNTWDNNIGYGTERIEGISWIADRLNCKITITETCDWDKSLRVARVKK